jgi:hypothetical protein
MLHHNDHSDAGGLISVVDVVNGTFDTSTCSLEDGRAVAVCGKIYVARGIDAGVGLAAGDC